MEWRPRWTRWPPMSLRSNSPAYPNVWNNRPMAEHDQRTRESYDKALPGLRPEAQNSSEYRWHHLEVSFLRAPLCLRFQNRKGREETPGIRKNFDFSTDLRISRPDVRPTVQVTGGGQFSFVSPSVVVPAKDDGSILLEWLPVAMMLFDAPVTQAFGHPACRCNIC